MNAEKPPIESRPEFSKGGDQPRKVKTEEVKNEKPKLESVVSGAVVQKKRSIGSRIKETLTGEDTKSVGRYVVFEVILPAAKAMFLDATYQGLERKLYGETSRGRRSSFSSSSRSSGYTPYNRRFDEPNRAGGRREIDPHDRAVHNFNNIIVESRGEGDAVIQGLWETLDEYGVATVAQFYQLVGSTGDFVDHKWGWTEHDLNGAKLRRVREGFHIDLPAPRYLD